MRTVIMSARLPASSEPISFSMPSARAPRMVAISSAGRRRQRLRIHRGDLLQLGREIHLLEHVEIVVAARRTVRTEPHRQIRAPASAITGATPLASFMLLDGQCATPTPRAFRIAMSASSTQTQCAATVRPLKTPSVSSTFVGRHVALGQRVVVLLLRLREVDDQRRVVFVGQRARRLQRLVGIGVERVRRDGGHDQRIVAEARQVLLGEGQRVGGRLVVGDRESR